LAGFTLLLFAVTWKLWTPQTVFPQIPFFLVLVEMPPLVDWVVGTFVAVCLTGMLIAKTQPRMRGWSFLFAVFCTGLVLLDQHRLQPWTYQFVVFALLIAACRSQSALFWMRWIVISIYLYSAISKFDYQFIHTVGEQMLSTVFGFIGLESSTWPEDIKSWLIIAFPLGELMVGAGLAAPKTRQLAILLAIGLHATLLLILGPWGMGHRPGVLVWNLFFIAQVVLLFRRMPSRSELGESATSKAGSSTRPLDFVGSIAAVTVILFPATQAIGICDHWPAWEVYAPRSSRAEIVNPNPEFESLSNPDPESGREAWFDLAQWSLSELGVPVYPEARFQLAVAIAVSEKYDLDRRFQVVVKSESNRRTGERRSDRLNGRDQLVMRARQYWLNTKARTIWLSN
jgi:hypothetical protein